MFPIFPFGAVVVHKQKKIVKLFQAANATSPDQATTSSKLGVHEGLAFKILLRHSILRDVGGQRIYVDESKWESHQKKRQRLAFIIPAIIIVGFFLGWGIVFLATRR